MQQFILFQPDEGHYKWSKPCLLIIKFVWEEDKCFSKLDNGTNFC